MEELDAIRKKKKEQLLKKIRSGNGEDTMDSGSNGKTVDINDGDLQSFIDDNPVVIIDCWAPWCGPCRMVAPVIEELAGELDGKVAFGKLNTDENPQTAMKYNIMSIPTLLLFSNGKHIDTMIGARPKEAILKQLQPLLE